MLVILKFQMQLAQLEQSLRIKFHQIKVAGWLCSVSNFVVLENIHAPPMDVLFSSLNPPSLWKFQFWFTLVP